MHGASSPHQIPVHCKRRSIESCYSCYCCGWRVKLGCIYASPTMYSSDTQSHNIMYTTRVRFNVINSSSNSWTWHVFLLYRWIEHWRLATSIWPWVTPYIDVVQRQLAVGYTLEWRCGTSIGRVFALLTLWNVNCCESVNNTSFHDRGRYAVRTTTDLFLKSVAILIISLTSLWYIVKE